MEYYAKLKELLEENMSEKGFKLWNAIDSSLTDIWSKPSSSTGKYHLKDGNRQPNIDEHVYDMAYVAAKLLRMFNVSKNSTEADVLFLAIALHDSLKYGETGNRPHTDKKHDRAAAEMISENQQTFTKLLTTEQYDILVDAVRFHSGQWSTDASIKDFNFGDRHHYAFFVHLLDMLSTNDLIKLPH